jgi:drug/metabolite transporter (DMT)-like permease
MYWWLYAVIAAIIWGFSYSALIPISSQLKPYTINSLYGLSGFIVNLIILLITDNISDYRQINNWKTIIYLITYIILAIAASIVFLSGYGSDGINQGIYIIIANIYPIITFIMSYFCFGKTDINPWFASFGIVLTLGGTCLLALAKR